MTRKLNAAPLLELQCVSRAYGTARALDQFSLAIHAGERIALVGANGAGKTTAIRILTGFVDADSGQLVRARGVRVGYLPEHAPLPLELDVNGFLRSRARLKGLAAKQIHGDVERVGTATGVREVFASTIGTLSKGFRQRVALADALLGAPSVLILDEPTSGLDPVQVRELCQRLRMLPTDRALLLSSHSLGELFSLATRVVGLARGRLLFDETPEQLCAGVGSGVLSDAIIARLEAAA